MNHALTILWAQWRSVRNGYPRRGVAWTAVVALIWYVLWAGLSVVIARIFSEAENLPMIHNVLPSGLFIVFLYWQLIPLLMATTGSTLELRKLRVYPIPESQLFRLEMMLRVTSGIEMIILLAGITVGVTLNPRLPGWALFAVLAYIVFNLSIAIGLRDLLARLLSR